RALAGGVVCGRGSVPTKAPRRRRPREVAERIKNDANRQFSPGWDPKRIWVDSMEEKDGTLSISGGAQATTDVTQFALRLQASVFFTDVQPMTVTAAVDGASKLAYYKFTLTGKVLY